MLERDAVEALKKVGRILKSNEDVRMCGAMKEGNYLELLVHDWGKNKVAQKQEAPNMLADDLRVASGHVAPNRQTPRT